MKKDDIKQGSRSRQIIVSVILVCIIRSLQLDLDVVGKASFFYGNFLVFPGHNTYIIRGNKRFLER